MNINLLPWREDLRKIKNNLFYASLLVVLGGCAMVTSFIHIAFKWMSQLESDNIRFLQKEKELLLNQVIEIQGLQKAKTALLQRRDIIQSLQGDRFAVLRLLDALPKITPEGIVLTVIERRGSKVSVFGSAETNATVATFLKNLQDETLETILTNVKMMTMSEDKTGLGVEFRLEFNIITPS